MAPTNILRSARTPTASEQGSASKKPRTRQPPREVLVRAGSAVIRARLLDTPTAERIWQALPIYSTAETWGDCLHFETRVETGREPSARQTVKPGDLAYWIEDDRIIIGYGPTPLSRPGEIRLPAPANVWARALDPVTCLDRVRPGEQVAVLVAES